MVDIVKQVIKYYLINKKTPGKNEIIVNDKSLLEKKGNVFVSVYKNGNIVGNAGNIIEIENDLVNELIENTVCSLNDPRFEKLKIEDLDKIKIRVDLISNRILLNKKFEELNPIKVGILAIRNDYKKLSIILPNISTTLTSGKDFVGILSKKLEEAFKQENYYVYEIETEVFTDY